MELHAGPRTHGASCRELEVSTGVMTNRLDRLERIGLVSRAKDPSDRRGVLLTLTPTGEERLDSYIDRGAHRELLLKLVDSLEAERGR